MKTLRLCLRPTEWESAFEQDRQRICVHAEVWEALTQGTQHSKRTEEIYVARDLQQASSWVSFSQTSGFL